MSRKRVNKKQEEEELPLQVTENGNLVPLEPTPPFSLDFNYGTGTRTIILPNGMDILVVAKIYTDLLDKYEVKYEIQDKSNPR